MAGTPAVVELELNLRVCLVCVVIHSGCRCFGMLQSIFSWCDCSSCSTDVLALKPFLDLDLSWQDHA